MSGSKRTLEQPASKRAKCDQITEVHAAVRDAERAEWIGNPYEIKYLTEQADRLRGKDAELELITQQLHQKAARDRRKFAAKTNSTETFTCSVCMDCLPLNALHVNVPCGHGFCKACIGKPGSPPGIPAAPGTQCHVCRAKVASVMQIFV